MHHGLRRGATPWYSKNYFLRNRCTTFVIRRHNEKFDNEDRAGGRESTVFDRPHGLYDSQSGMTGDTMGDLVNLKQFKKRAARDRSEQEAAANRARFGRTRSERALDEMQSRRDRELLDQRRIDGEDAS